MELWAPYYRLLEEGAEVVVVGSGSAQEYKGKHGYQTRGQRLVSPGLARRESGPRVNVYAWSYSLGVTHQDSQNIPGGIAGLSRYTAVQ